MTLECTLVRGPAAAVSAAPEELSISVANGTSGAHVQRLLEEAHGTGRLYVEAQDLSTLTVGEPPLMSGAVVVDGPALLRDPGGTPLPMMLVAHSGPGAGSVYRLQRGRYLIGRGAVDISVPDPGMSREHALLDVSSTALTLTQIGGANPVFVDGEPSRRRTVTSASIMRLGNSTFTIYADNMPFQAISTSAGVSVEEPIEVPHAKGSANRLTVALAAALPLIVGVGLAIATGMWMYLGFTAISAVSMFVPMITGRKSRREFRQAVAHAAHADVERRRRCSPSAADFIVAAHPLGSRVGLTTSERGKKTTRPTPKTSPSEETVVDFPGVWVRLGTMPALANVRMVPEDPQFRPPSIGSAALTLSPQSPVVTLRGQEFQVDAILRFIVMQLAGFPSSKESPVIVLGPVERLPLSARFLPRITLVTHQTAALEACRQLSRGPQGRLIVLDHPACVDPEALPQLLSAARLASWQVIHHSDSAETTGLVIDIAQSGTTASMDSGDERRQFTPDMVGIDVFDQFCRRMATQTDHEVAAGNHEIAASCSLSDLLSSGQRSIHRRWADPAQNNALSAVLGQGIDGLLTFDFKADGPHLLVAGTTGSGKSELLKTLVASLALKHPPDRASFLFFDFKGGSGLGPLAGLPHCVGLLTDLGKHHLDRALMSLRGEIQHREKLFATVGASDLAAYERSKTALESPIPHLVLVVDEFRMLVDENPAALRELMRIATIGRSLGIHLVMATQRPQGALSADIRANVTSSIALRVQSEMESVDIINSKVAASIGVNTPGRAFLARASGSPEEFQTASLSVSTRDSALPGRCDYGLQTVQSAARALTYLPDPPAAAVGSHDPGGDPGTRKMVSAVQEAWNFLLRPLPRRPIAAPLPASIGWDDQLDLAKDPWTRQSNEPGQRIVGPLALFDRPEQQIVEHLLWSPSEHGHLAMIGGASSGMHECFRAVSALLATQEPKPHLYVLDAAGLLAGNPAERELFGAAAGLHEMHLAVRVLKRLAGELERRRAAGDEGRSHRPLALIVAGWCSWATALRSGPFGWAEEVLQDIVRDGGPLGIAVLISGERELVASRFFAGIQNRAYFPSGSTDESRFHWPRLPDVENFPGRAFIVGNFVGGDTAVAQFREAPGTGRWPFGSVTSSEAPFRVRPLPGLLSPQDFHAQLNAVDSRNEEMTQQRPLWVGVGGDESTPISLPLRPHGVSVILGAHGSGKSSTLGALCTLNPAVPWVFPPKSTSANMFWVSAAQEAEGGTLDPDSILLVDDADTLDAQGHQALMNLAGKVRGIVMTATTGPTLLQRLPLVRDVQASGLGIVLAPRTSLDGDLLGVRLDADPAGSAGRGFVVRGPEVRPFQGVLTSGFPPPAVDVKEDSGHPG
ncbi:FtsK/SpoIIIE domain-containing protein [Paenarthrobacter sp. NPDC056912]|uniref:FtsK/SpoIIIE domain-containing protein n=1 Tax=Paenarthrobacter sp. NPDC056912 TaxID=3345965 RepID=UPI00367261DA